MTHGCPLPYGPSVWISRHADVPRQDSLSDRTRRSPLVPRYSDAGHEEKLSILARIPCLRRDQRFLVGQIDEQLQFHLLSAGTVEAFDRIALLACDCLRGVEILTETR